MELSELISEERVLLDVDADCPKALFRCVSELLEPLTNIPARNVCNALQERERLGSTAVGEGVSIPHARIDGIEKIQGFFLRLAKPINMDAVDDKPVDLFFILLVPAEADQDHLRMLSRIARLLRGAGMQAEIRAASSKAEIVALISDG